MRLEEVSRARTGQRFAFVMDTAVCDGARWLAQRADLLVCEATYAAADGELAAAYGHLTARDAGQIAAGGHARRLVLTHFSQRYADLTPLLRRRGAEHDDVVLARDLDRMPVPARARASRAPMSSPATRGLPRDGPDGSPRSEGDLLPDHPPAPLGAPCWIDLNTSDLDRAVPFYGELFGWTAEDAGEDYGHYHQFSKDGALVAGLMRQAARRRLPRLLDDLPVQRRRQGHRRGRSRGRRAGRCSSRWP